MTKNEIIEKWYRDGVVQEIIKNITGSAKGEKFDDLTQIIYLSLLEKEEKFIQELYESDQYRFYISRMVILQISSTHSRLYYDDKRFSLRTEEYDNCTPDATPYDNKHHRRVKEEYQQFLELAQDLDEPEREYLQYYIDGYSQVDVAEMLGITPSSAHKRLSRICRILKWFRDVEEAKRDGKPIPKSATHSYHRKIDMQTVTQIYKNNILKRLQKQK